LDQVRSRDARAQRRVGAVLVGTIGIAFHLAASSRTPPAALGLAASPRALGATAAMQVVFGGPVGLLAPEPRLRVGILPEVARVSIGADTGVVVFALRPDGAPAGPRYALRRATFQPLSLPPAGGAPGRLRLVEARAELQSAAVLPAVVSEPLSADATPYRGYLEVRAAAGALSVVNVVNVEDYVRGVVPNELSPLAAPEPEAMKAQAVAARTYALRNRGEYASKGYDLCATPACQVYRGLSTEHPLADRAVAETRGLLVRYRGVPINALYTSACGGHTEDGENVFEGGRAKPYLRGVLCPPERQGATEEKQPDGPSADLGTPARRWQVRMTPVQVARAVGRYGTLAAVRDIQPRRVGVSGRVVELAVLGAGEREELVLKGVEVPRGLGLRESLFVMDRETDAKGSVRRFVFSGMGWGHGVGLCQAGAFGMARSGASFQQILTHYYTGVSLHKAY
jgi:stage II sporulation protein D